MSEDETIQNDECCPNCGAPKHGDGSCSLDYIAGDSLGNINVCEYAAGLKRERDEARAALIRIVATGNANDSTNVEQFYIDIAREALEADDGCSAPTQCPADGVPKDCKWCQNKEADDEC